MLKDLLGTITASNIAATNGQIVYDSSHSRDHDKGFLIGKEPHKNVPKFP